MYVFVLVFSDLTLERRYLHEEIGVQLCCSYWCTYKLVTGVYSCLFNSNVNFFLMLFQSRSYVYLYKFMRITPHDTL
jgi:hypothetical protein